MNDIWRFDTRTLVYEKFGKLKYKRAYARAFFDKSRFEI